MAEKTITVKLTASEHDALSELMNEMYDRMSNAGCNDYFMKNTPSNRVLIKNVCKESGCLLENLYPNGIGKGEKELFVFDMDLLFYLMQKMKIELKDEE